MRDTRKITIFLAVVSLLFILGQFFFVPKTYVNSVVLSAIRSPRILFDALRNRYVLANQLRDTQLENQSLRAQLERAESRAGIIKEDSREYVRAPVYSVYPLNNAGRLTVAAGTAQGIAVGMAVLARPDIFVGEVVEVSMNQSEVRTINDLGWELPVKIGTEKIDALLVSGHRPLLKLISKKKNSAPGMSVFLVSKKYSYGLTLGSTGDLADSGDNLFKESPLVLPYEFGALSDVYIDLH